MMLKIVGSSSKGNCYIMEAVNGDKLMIECGCNYKETQISLCHDISSLKGIIITHEHGDHARTVKRYLDYNVPVYCSEGTATALGIVAKASLRPMKEFATYFVGSFIVKPFPVQHDAAQPFGYLIHHSECGLTLFATDTFYLKYNFQELNNILIECNYKKSFLDANEDISLKRRNRTMKSHMELEQCKGFLMANDLSKVNNIVLIHLSEGNGDPNLFKHEIEQLTCKNVTIAEAGMTIKQFNSTPF